MVLYAGFRSNGYHTSRNCMAWNHSLLGLPRTINQRGQGLPDDASNIPLSLIHSHLLDEVTPSGSRLIAFTPLLLTCLCRAHARGCRSHPTTWAVGFDDLRLRRDNLTDIGTQLQREVVSPFDELYATQWRATLFHCGRMHQLDLLLLSSAFPPLTIGQALW
jgi:hypothetical protein